MIKHVVMFKLLEPTPENLQSAKEKLLAMDGQIDILKDLVVGVNILDSERAYDLVLESKFDTIEDLKTYANHPVHLPVVEYMRKVCSVIAMVDYKI